MLTDAELTQCPTARLLLSNPQMCKYYAHKFLKSFDVNSSGQLELLQVFECLQKIFKSAGLKVVSFEKVEKAFHEHDKSHTDGLTPSEFESFFKKTLRFIAKEGAGEIDLEQDSKPKDGNGQRMAPRRCGPRVNTRNMAPGVNTQRQLPDGSWLKSARNINVGRVIEHGELCAELQRNDGSWCVATVELEENTSYSNNDGRFQIEKKFAPAMGRKVMRMTPSDAKALGCDEAPTPAGRGPAGCTRDGNSMKYYYYPRRRITGLSEEPNV